MPLLGNEVLYVFGILPSGGIASIPEQTTVAAVGDTRTVDYNVTALGNGRATAYVLTKQITYFTAVASSTGALLPSAVKPGLVWTVYNAGAQTLTVYGAGSDTIDGTAGSTGVTIGAGKRAQFSIMANGIWVSALLGATTS